MDSFGVPSNDAQSCGSHDMYMNFMDYVDDTEMVMFTNDQINRALSLFSDANAYRKDFIYKTHSNRTYINRISFKIMDTSQQSNPCGIYDEWKSLNLNMNSNSKKYVYMCLHKTNDQRFNPITNYVFVSNQNECSNYGLNYIYSTVNINVNNPNEIHICYETFNFNNNNNNDILYNNNEYSLKVITDIDFIENSNKDVYYKTHQNYNIIDYNINPNGNNIISSYKEEFISFIKDENFEMETVVVNTNIDAIPAKYNSDAKYNEVWNEAALKSFIIIILVVITCVFGVILCNKKSNKNNENNLHEYRHYGTIIDVKS